MRPRVDRPRRGQVAGERDDIAVVTDPRRLPDLVEAAPRARDAEGKNEGKPSAPRRRNRSAGRTYCVVPAIRATMNGLSEITGRRACGARSVAIVAPLRKVEDWY